MKAWRFDARPARRLGLLLLCSACVGLAGPAWGEPHDDPDAALRDRIEAGLGRLREDPAVEILVTVRDGQVLLRGRVALLEHSLRAEQAAWTTPGVVDVDNELRVVPPPGSGDASIEGRVRTAVKGDARFVDTNLEITVRAGIVELRGFFQDPTDVLALKHRVAAIPGVLEVRIDARVVASLPEPREAAPPTRVDLKSRASSTGGCDAVSSVRSRALADA